MSNTFATLWTVTHQAPLFMGFPKQEYWSGLPFLSPGALLDSGMEPTFLAVVGGFFTTEPQRKTSTLWVGMQIGAASVEDNMEGPWKTKNRTTIWSSNPTPGHISRRDKSSNSKRYMYPSVHSSTLYKGQDVEATKVLINRWLGVFPTQGSNLCLLNCRQILYHWATRETQWHVTKVYNIYKQSL